MTRRKRKRKDEQRRDGSGPLQLHEIAKMRAAGRLAAELLDMVAREIRAGMSTQDIDRMVDETTRARGAISAPYRYHGFPAHCCTSINDVVCHGIPDPQRVLREGDIINVDVTPILDDFHGDASRTFMIGAVSPAAERLVQDTNRALWKGISAVHPGGTTGDIGHAIQSFVEPRGYSVVRQFSGHGIGRVFHTAPPILHYGRPGTGERLVPGMTFTIEPMINLGDWRCNILQDGWTAVTVDGSLSAQFEHTVLVTEVGVEVLTLGAGEALQIEPPSAAQPRRAAGGRQLEQLVLRPAAAHQHSSGSPPAVGRHAGARRTPSFGWANGRRPLTKSSSVSSLRFAIRIAMISTNATAPPTAAGMMYTRLSLLAAARRGTNAVAVTIAMLSATTTTSRRIIVCALPSASTGFSVAACGGGVDRELRAAPSRWASRASQPRAA